MSSGDYDKQDRGSDDAYARYLRGMDASMRQKVALTAAHLVGEGELADMGMGSGSGSHALACLYPSLNVIGVDVDPEMVKRAGERYRASNLRFVTGDIAAVCFDNDSIEAILNSSVLHHVTSFSDYDRDAARRALAVQVQQLAPQGVVIVRDFVDPGPETVWLDLPANDGSDDSSDVLTCSTAALFERFTREFRCLHEDPLRRGFEVRRPELSGGPALQEGWRRYELSHTHAAEFVLRKDYRQSWGVEVQEEYTYATQSELETWFCDLGLRVLASTPIRNPWIVNHRFVGFFRLWSLSGEPLDVPATNVLVVGQKVRSEHGTRIALEQRTEPVGYLSMAHYRDTKTGVVHQLARRPGDVVDVVPYFVHEGALHVLARRAYPRPVTACGGSSCRVIDGTTPVQYITEPLNIAVEAAVDPDTVVAELGARFEQWRVLPGATLEFVGEHYPSPGGIAERVRSGLVAIEPTWDQDPIASTSGFSSSGTLRSIEARQVLRAAQVSALPEARLELATYHLLLEKGYDPGPWIGEAVRESSSGPVPSVTELNELLDAPARDRFEITDEGSDFLVVRSGRFVERDASGAACASQVREWVEPRHYGIFSLSVAVLWLDQGDAYLVVEDDDRPAAQHLSGSSQLLTLPAWRLPKDVGGIAESRAWVADKVREQVGLRVGPMHELGGRYHPSAGLTPEAVYPLLAVGQSGTLNPGFHLVSLRELVRARHRLVDGHLRIACLRAAHAIGLLSEMTETLSA